MMPRGKKTNGASNQLPTFIACTLSAEELATVQAHLLNDTGICEYIHVVLEAGLKLSVSNDAYNDCITVTITKPADEKGAAGRALSSRGPELADAMSVSAYKFHEKLDGDFATAALAKSQNSWG